MRVSHDADPADDARQLCVAADDVSGNNARPARHVLATISSLLFAAATFLPAGPVIAQGTEGPQFELVWSIDGGPNRSSRSLDPTIAIAPDKVLIDANVTYDDRRHEAIRGFDMAEGRPFVPLEHPDGVPFGGFGDFIAINDRFMVTSHYGKASSGEEGEIFVYDAQTLDLLRRIQNPRAEDSTYFAGTDVVLHGDRILASIPQAEDNATTAWVFSAATGEVVLTLDEPDLPETSLGSPRRSLFGRALAMNATHIAISALDRDGPAGSRARGIVYVFDAQTGALLYRLRTPGSERANGFGTDLVMSDDRLYVTGFDDTGALDWPTGQVHSYDLATGDLIFSVEDPGVPQTEADFAAGVEGWGFPAGLSVDGPFLFSGLPNWSGTERQQGGLIVFDARSGDLLLTYGHQSGARSARFGTAIAADHGHLAVMEEIRVDGALAARVALFRVTAP
ncbi:MAG: hypothetical protein AAF376_03955 [Pseudomonadota bacterium]